jgi:hypothetical protein
MSHTSAALAEVHRRVSNPPVPPAEVVAKPDPEQPGRTAYHIVGLTRAAVQDAITGIMNEVEDRGGVAHFVGPMRLNGGFGAAGLVTLAVPA